MWIPLVTRSRRICIISWHQVCMPDDKSTFVYCGVTFTLRNISAAQVHVNGSPCCVCSTVSTCKFVLVSVYRFNKTCVSNIWLSNLFSFLNICHCFETIDPGEFTPLFTEHIILQSDAKYDNLSDFS